MRNLITDVPGLKVGNADDAELASGVTAIVFDEPAVASGDVRGGAPGTRETDLLAAGRDGRAHRRDRAVRRLGVRARRAGRRAGLAARAGPRLRDRRRCACRSCRARSCSTCSTAATRTGAAFRPIAISAMRRRPMRRHDFALGSVGAGFGATTVNLKGGLGSASATTRDGAIGRRDRGGQRGRQRHRRRRAAFLGGAVRAERRVRRARPAAIAAAATRSHPPQGRRRARTPRSRWSRPTRP